MKQRKFLIPIAVALTALTTNVEASISDKPASQQTAGSASDNLQSLIATTQSPQELFGFVLKPSEGGEIFAGHRSHRSHRSHSSHRSHYSSR